MSSFAPFRRRVSAPARHRRTGLATEAVRTLVAIGLAAASASGAAFAASSAETPLRPGRLVAGIERLHDPVAIAVDAAGRLLVLERTAAAISVFDPPQVPDPLPAAPDPVELLSPDREPPAVPMLLRRAQFGDAVLARPEAMAVAADGSIAVADSAARAILMLESDGRLRRRLGEGTLLRPLGVAIDEASDAVLVADEVLRAVLRLPRDGSPAEVIMRFVPARSGERITAAAVRDGSGQVMALRQPVGVSVLSGGRIAVVDAGHARVIVLDSAADAAWSFGDYGPFPGLMERPWRVREQGGRLVVMDRGNHRLQEHAIDGTLLGLWGIHARRPHEGGGVIHDPSDIAFGPEGRYAAILEPFEDRVQVFARDPVTEPTDPARLPQVERDAHFGVRVAADGPLLVLAEPEAHRVHLFDARRPIPILVGDFGERGEGFGLLLRPEGLSLDAEAGLIHVGDLARRRLQQFLVAWDPDAPTGFVPGRFRFARSVDLAAVGVQLADAGADAAAAAIPVEPADLLAEPGGGVLVVDSAGDRLVRMDRRLQVTAVFGGRGTEPGRFRRPTAVARSADGSRLFVVDADNHRVQVLDAATGAPLAAWGTRIGPAEADAGAGAAGSGFVDPFGIAVDAAGGVFVSDRGAHRVLKFSYAGERIGGFGGRGPADRDLWKPGDLAVATDGRIIVVDYGNHRPKLFDADGTWWATFGTGRAVTRDDGQRERPAARPVPRRTGGGER